MPNSRLQGAERLERRVKIGFAVVVTVLAAVGATWYRGTARYVQDNRWVQHTYDVIDALDDLLGLAKDAELGERGYLITSDTSYLRTYNDALGLVSPTLVRLRALTSDNPVEQARVPLLERALAERLGILERVVALQRGGQQTAAIALVQAGSGKRAMDEVRRIVATMHRDESQLLVARSQRFRQSERNAFLISAAALLLVLVVLMVLYYFGRVEITERLRAEREARISTREALEARMAAERAVEARSQFLANMSHEIRTPMNAVMGMTELLLDTEVTSDQRRSLRLIQSSAESLLAIINDILDISKIESGSLELESIPFDLPGLVDTTARLLAGRGTQRPVELLCDVRADVPRTVRGDPGRLRQILTNLLGNALKFTERGEVVVTVRLTATQGGLATVQFSVRDTGIGIPADKLDVIFEQFRQADASTTRRYGGTGLGLAIVRRLVTIMGGELHVESALGRGSDFSFVLHFPLEAALLHTLPPPAELRGTRVLVVDDNTTNRRIVREMLAGAGATVDEAPTADAGLGALHRAQLAGEPYNLAIIDGQMPDRDGFELAETVRSDRRHGSTRLLMLTSMGQKGDAQRCRDLGIQAYLTKPISRAELVMGIAAVLGATLPPDGRGPVITRHTIEEARRHLRVLLAEDNPVNQEVAATMLRKRGHSVDIVGDGQAAVAAVTRNDYDLVLMDVQMPLLDGFAATAAIRALAKGRALPIYALTAHALAGERDKAIAAGMSGYLSKPFKAHELFALVEGGDEARADAGGEAPAPAGAVDLEGFRRELREAGAEDAVAAVLETFVTSAPQQLEVLAVAVAAGDAAAAARAAHTFKAGAGAIRARPLAELLRQAEEAGRAGRADALRERMPVIRESLREVLEAISREP
jgi:two-component system sensor histidine kinase/response regulator